MITATDTRTTMPTNTTDSAFDHLIGRMVNPALALSMGVLDQLGTRCGARIRIQEQAEDITVKAYVPGMKSTQLQVDVKDDTLIIRGQHAELLEEREVQAIDCGRTQGRFERVVHLPAPVDEDFIDAVLEDGILTITLGKVQDTPTRHVSIRNA